MPRTTIRQLHGDEMLEVLRQLNSYAFIASPPLDTKSIDAHYCGRQGLTCWTLFEGSTAVAGATSRAMTQHVRGAIFPIGGVEGVATLPLARRKGYSRQVVAHLLQADRESGKVLSCLYPFRESFYERLGYISLPLPIIARFETAALAPLAKNELGDETTELLPISQAYEAYRRYLYRLQSHVHGMALSDFGEPAGVPDRQWVLLAKVDGETDGCMLYRLQGDTYNFDFHASRFYYFTSRGRYLLLSWIARHIDQATRAELWLPRNEHPETWLADLHVKVESQEHVAMARVLDVAQLGGMQAGPGHFSAHITDPLCPWNKGDWQFQANDGLLQVTRVDTAQCSLTVQALTALAYGTHDPQDFALRGWGDPSPDLQATMRTMFPPMTPYMHEFF